jgi:hypothetical protein
MKHSAERVGSDLSQLYFTPRWKSSRFEMLAESYHRGNHCCRGKHYQ